MTAKKVLLYGINYGPEPIGIPRYTTEMAEDMATAGHDVIVVSAAPLYPAWKKRAGYAYHRYTREERNGVKIVRVPTYVPRDTSFRQRVAYELVFLLASLPVVLRECLKAVDLLVITSPPLALCLALLLPRRRARAAVIVKDLQVDIAETMGLIRNRLALRLLFRIERWLLTRADVVTAVSTRMLKRIRSKGVAEERSALFPDWVDVNRMVEAGPGPVRAMRTRLGLPPDKLVVGYTGNLGRKQGVELCVEIARRFQAEGRDQLHVLICGEGPAKPEVERMVAELGLTNVTLRPLQPEEDLPALISAIDLHLVPQRNEVSDLVMPGKLFNIMSCARPVVVTAPPGSAIDRVMKVSRAGVRVSREEMDALHATIAELCAQPERRRKMGRAGRAYVLEHFAKCRVLDEFYKRVGLL